MPSLSIFGDGRIFVGGPQIEIYPPPAMVNPLFGKLSEDDLQDPIEFRWSSSNPRPKQDLQT